MTLLGENTAPPVVRKAKALIKGAVGERGVQVVRRLDRFRYLLKIRRVREEGASFVKQPLIVARFVLLDPETHSYSYDLANTDELVDFAAELLGAGRRELRGYVAETESDPELNERLRSRTRWRVDSKWRLPLGNRLLWYLVARATKPRLIVETGIFDGLGSLMLLRALERNAQDGVEGRLVSIDIDPAAGWLVPDHLTERWEPICGDIFQDLEPVLAGRPVDLLIHDSVHTEEFQRFEFDLALRNAASPLHVIDSSGLMLGVLREVTASRGGRHAYFLERPARHFYKPSGTSVAIFDAPGG